jgi:glycosyltransferase involved in cell wall biosynthesis
MTILLSICIPTYNRAVYLDQLLVSIASGIKDFESIIEVVISDNAGTDNTRDVVSKYAATIPNLKYLRQETALLPPEKNFYFLGSNASGKYVWLIGDDDCVSSNGIKRVVEALASSPDLCICNFSMMSKDFETVLLQAFYKQGKSTVLKNPDAVMRGFGPTLSLISILVIKSEIFRSVEQEKYLNFAPFGLSFLFLVYSTIKKVPAFRGVFIEEMVIRYRSGNTAIPNWINTFVTGFNIVASEIKARGYMRQSIAAYKNMVIQRYIFREFLSRKAQAEDVSAIIKEVARNYADTASYWLMFFPLVLFPGTLLRIARKLWQYIK